MEKIVKTWKSPATNKKYRLDWDGTVTVTDLCEFYGSETEGAACEVCPHREDRWTAEPLPCGQQHCWCDCHQHNI